ncbi:alpha/beta hydrolase [Acidiphilium sp. PA]|uniref:alpha/beta hydrolase n=1 Tax=Acidiphilium sp. PA TaxID=2871705 RepID=UPI002244962B|nr:prolyl oligopeptidase family serine peptidase [Acidiphilium sp. PA]MCW8306398.1 alpha/beta hydrolase [Acidiphilium sp. PA]
MAVLDGPRWGPAAGAAKQLIVLCHGVGADGNDLIDLAPYWAKAAPEAAFVSPHAPEPFAMAPHGRQWFDIGDRDPARLAAGVRRARVAVDAFLDAELSRLGLPPDAYALMGFSQGAMTVLFTGLRRAVPPRAILAFSGALIDPDSLAHDLTGRPPVLLVHGIEDQVVPVSRSRDAEAVLRANDVPVQALYVPRLAHGIEDSGLSAGALALQKGFATGV